MVSFDLDKFLTGHAYAFTMIFSRIGTIVMLMPGIGESYVPTRSRLAFALCLSLVVMEPLMGRLPPVTVDVSKLAALVGYEVMIGLFFGMIMRLIMDVLETTGSIIAIQTGLSNATVFNPALAAQSPLPSALLGVVGVVLIFATGLDHMLLRGMVESYAAFPPGAAWVPGDVLQAVAQTMGKSFSVGIQLSMPFTVMALLMFTALGMMQKLMPSIQLFLISMPLQIWVGLLLIAATAATIMTAWLHYFDSTITTLLEH